MLRVTTTVTTENDQMPKNFLDQLLTKEILSTITLDTLLDRLNEVMKLEILENEVLEKARKMQEDLKGALERVYQNELSSGYKLPLFFKEMKTKKKTIADKLMRLASKELVDIKDAEKFLLDYEGCKDENLKIDSKGGRLGNQIIDEVKILADETSELLANQTMHPKISSELYRINENMNNHIIRTIYAMMAEEDESNDIELTCQNVASQENNERISQLRFYPHEVMACRNGLIEEVVGFIMKAMKENDRIKFITAFMSDHIGFCNEFFNQEDKETLIKEYDIKIKEKKLVEDFFKNKKMSDCIDECIKKTIDKAEYRSLLEEEKIILPDVIKVILKKCVEKSYNEKVDEIKKESDKAGCVNNDSTRVIPEIDRIKVVRSNKVIELKKRLQPYLNKKIEIDILYKNRKGYCYESDRSADVRHYLFKTLMREFSERLFYEEKRIFNYLYWRAATEGFTMAIGLKQQSLKWCEANYNGDYLSSYTKKFIRNIDYLIEANVDVDFVRFIENEMKKHLEESKKDTDPEKQFFLLKWHEKINTMTSTFIEQLNCADAMLKTQQKIDNDDLASETRLKLAVIKNSLSIYQEHTPTFVFTVPNTDKAYEFVILKK